MPANASQFERHLRGDAPAPVYLLAGSEPLLVLEAGDRLRRRARAWGFDEREVFDAEGGFDWNALVGAFSAMSLFSQRRLLELRLPTGRPGREGAQVITEYCANPPPDTLLLVNAGQWSNKHEGAWSKAIDRAGIMHVLWPLKPSEMPEWIRDRLARHGLAAEPAAARLLVERVEGNLLAAAQEIDKLVLVLGDAGKGSVIDAARMQELVADSARYDVFGMTEAALAGDALRVRRMLAGLRAEGEQIPPMLAWIASQLELLSQFAGIKAAGGNLGAAMSAARLWEARQSLFRRALERAGPNHWEAMLAWLAKVDRMSKGREYGDAWREFERLLVAVAQPRTRPALAG